ncbi:hypothetical protein GCM10027451_27990 [Geodermatophilus aquaeductus]
MAEDRQQRGASPRGFTGGAAPRTTVSAPGEKKGGRPAPVAQPSRGPERGPTGGSGQAKAE